MICNLRSADSPMAIAQYYSPAFLCTMPLQRGAHRQRWKVTLNHRRHPPRFSKDAEMSSTQGNWISDTRAVLQESNVDFFRVKPSRYWFDFLLSVTLGYAAGSVY